MFTGGVIVELFECESEDKALHIALCDNRADLYPLCFDLWSFKVSSYAANTQSKNMYLTLKHRRVVDKEPSLLISEGFHCVCSTSTSSPSSFPVGASMTLSAFLCNFTSIPFVKTWKIQTMRTGLKRLISVKIWDFVERNGNAWRLEIDISTIICILGHEQIVLI